MNNKIHQHSNTISVVTIVGARPNFVKLAALHEALSKRPECQHTIIHTGQHYDFKMNEAFFQELCLPNPHYHLAIGSGSHAEQVGNTMIALERILSGLRPDWILVVGDVNATLSASICAKKLGLRLGHVEAGLRSFDWTMPEEINRIVTDRLSDALFVSEISGQKNLLHEGTEENRIIFVGNVMIDILYKCLPMIEKNEIVNKLNLAMHGYAVLTMHRPSNIDDPHRLKEWMSAFENFSQHMPIVFPVHPRTWQQMNNLDFRLSTKGLHIIEPLGYLDMLALMKNARIVLTDSGGIQEETTALGIPCLTLRDNTERPITIEEGTNSLVGSNPKRLEHYLELALSKMQQIKQPRGWDGKAAERIADFLIKNRKFSLRTH